MAGKDKSGKVTQADSSKENRTDKVSGRSFGRGMTSPDSTEAVLNASTGEVDPRAAGEGALPPGESEPNRNKSGQGNSGHNRSNRKK